MKHFVLLFAVAFSSSSIAEEVQTTDGRSILLKADGTYEILQSSVPNAAGILEVTSHMFERHTDKYSRSSIRFMPIFRNKSERTVTAIRFTTHFLDPFGEEILKSGGRSEERIEPGRKSTTRLFYSFENNQFIYDQPYDKLLSSVMNGTGSIRTEIDAIVFEDSEVVRY